MKHLASCIIALILSFVGLSVKAQNSTSTQIEIENLSSKVKTLEHDLIYLKLTSELKILDNNINLAVAQADIKSLEMQLYAFHSNLTTNDMYYDMLKEWYQAVLEKKQSLVYLYTQIKQLVSSSTDVFTENENYLLNIQCDVIDMAFNSFDATLNIVEHLLEALKSNS